ncbi:MAG: ABC transporter ATP-binding protein [Myxococcales bacterium]|nr:ABC transporter ATP-binding protein [Myxococcales bacterium]
MPLIELEGVEKRYGELRALQDVSLILEPGRIGLLGPNGAGKSTLLKVLLGIVPHDHGSVKVFERDVAREPFEIRARIGFMPEGDAVFPELSALEFVTLAAELCGLPRAEAVARAHQVLHYCGLGEARYRRLGSFSTGMRQRARLAQALVGDPNLLLLDEPTSGLDPRGRDEMLELIYDIPQRTGASVILSTHILPDVEKTCDQVLVIASGKILYAGPLAPLIQVEEGVYEIRVKGEEGRLRGPLEASGCIVRKATGHLEVRIPEGHGAEYVLAVAHAAGVQIRHIAPLARTLERAFMQTLEGAGAIAPEGA